jgi:hypothetical protein
MKATPKTNNEAVLKYNTCFEQCQCPDFQNRGGSYRDPLNNDSVCKHMAHYRNNIRFAEEHNYLITVQAYEARQQQEVKAKQAIERLYGPSVQIVAPVKSMIEWADFLEIDPPARKEPSAEELFARF